MRRRNMARAIDLAWRSLRSHLADAVTARTANVEFHARCCSEYSEIIYIVAVELHELAKKDFKRQYEDLREPV